MEMPSLAGNEMVFCKIQLWFSFLFHSIHPDCALDIAPDQNPGYAQARCCIWTLPYTPAKTGMFLCLGCTGTWDLVIDCTSLIFCVFFFVTWNIFHLNLVWKKKDNKNHHVQELNIRAPEIHVEHSTTEPLKQNSWLVFTSHLYLYYPHDSSGLCVRYWVHGTTNATNRSD